VVAQQIPDLPEMSITHKTVGRRFATSAVRSNRMANKGPDTIPPGPKLDALTAEKDLGKIAR
jgi:hypothetical protein